MPKFDAFISYARQNLDWVHEELLPALQSLNLTFFIDDAQSYGMQNATGLEPGVEIKSALREAFTGSRYVLLVQSPSYFASHWCRWEIDEVEALVKAAQRTAPDNAGASSGIAEKVDVKAARPELLYLIYSRDDGRLDSTPWGSKHLYIDLCDVRQRSRMLAGVLKRLCPELLPTPIKLGSASLRDLLRDEVVKGQMQALRERQKEFREAHSKVDALKEVHDAFQSAQDAWRTLSSGRDQLKQCMGRPSVSLIEDLQEKCEDILTKAENLHKSQGVRFAWLSQIKRAISNFESFSAQPTNLESLNTVLEQTRAILVLSVAPVQLNDKIHDALESLPLQELKSAIEPLLDLARFDWSTKPREAWDKLSTLFAELDKQLRKVLQLMEVHDVLQNIDTIFSSALHPEARLADIKNIWLEIECYRKTLPQESASADFQWLKRLHIAALEVGECLVAASEPEIIPKEEIERFRNRLNQVFTRADTDLKQSSSSLDQQLSKIESQLEWLAKLVQI